jgi:hypothetical protein
MRGILRRIRSLNQRVLPSEAGPLPKLPLWHLQALEAHLGIPVDDFGRANSAAVRKRAPRPGPVHKWPSSVHWRRASGPRRDAHSSEASGRGYAERIESATFAFQVQPGTRLPTRVWSRTEREGANLCA